MELFDTYFVWFGQILVNTFTHCIHVERADISGM